MRNVPFVFLAATVLFAAPQVFAQDSATSSQEDVACTQDAKICPDGSAVGRVAPSCEFAACPVESAPIEEVDEEPLPDPGITPDSPFYFLDDAWKSLRLTFTRSADKKAELRLEFANEKLAELEQMVVEGKDQAVAAATARYEENLAAARERLESAELTDEQMARLEERIASATERHERKIEQIENRAEQRLEHLVDRARKISSEVKITALGRLEQLNPERAAEIAARSIENRVRHVEELLENTNLTEEERAKLEERLGHLTELETVGLDALENLPESRRIFFRQRFDSARSRAEFRLEELLLQNPDTALPGLENALERIRLHSQNATSTATSSSEIQLRIEQQNREIRQRIEQRNTDLRTRFLDRRIEPSREPDTNNTVGDTENPTGGNIFLNLFKFLEN